MDINLSIHALVILGIAIVCIRCLSVLRERIRYTQSIAERKHARRAALYADVARHLQQTHRESGGERYRKSVSQFTD